MSDAVQLDLFATGDSICEETEDRFLCEGWKSAKKKENGCFGDHTFFFTAGKRTETFLELGLAKYNGNVYGEISFQIGAPSYFGVASHVGVDEPLIKFSIYEPPENVRHYLLKTINQKLNQYDCEKYRLKLYDLADSVVEKAMDCMLKDNREEVRRYHWGVKKDVNDYVTKMLNLEDNYDLSDDELIGMDDVVGHCMECNAPITKSDICRVNAVNYTWKHKDGHTFEAYKCFGKHSREYGKKNPGSMGPGYYYDFHQKYLELCGLTEEEYKEDLKKNSPTVYQAIYGNG